MDRAGCARIPAGLRYGVGAGPPEEPTSTARESSHRNDRARTSRRLRYNPVGRAFSGSGASRSQLVCGCWAASTRQPDVSGRTAYVLVSMVRLEKKASVPMSTNRPMAPVRGWALGCSMVSAGRTVDGGGHGVGGHGELEGDPFLRADGESCFAPAVRVGLTKAVERPIGVGEVLDGTTDRAASADWSWFR